MGLFYYFIFWEKHFFFCCGEDWEKQSSYYYFFLYKIEFILEPQDWIFLLLLLFFFRNLNLDPLLSHFINIYTCRVITALRVSGGYKVVIIKLVEMG